MDAIYIARAIGGLLTIVTLLGMVVAQFVYPHLQISQGTLYLLLLLISSFFGMDILKRYGGITVQMGTRGGNEDD